MYVYINCKVTTIAIFTFTNDDIVDRLSTPKSACHDYKRISEEAS